LSGAFVNFVVGDGADTGTARGADVQAFSQPHATRNAGKFNNGHASGGTSNNTSAANRISAHEMESPKFKNSGIGMDVFGRVIVEIPSSKHTKQIGFVCANVGTIKPANTSFARTFLMFSCIP
jgi:hypothetical protein